MAIKTVTLTIKVSEEDKKYIQQLAAKEGSTVSTYLYNIIFNQTKENDK